MTEGRPTRGEAATREWNAAAYHRVSEPQFAWGLKVLERLTLTGAERVLDAGCGSGRLTAELSARLPNGFVVGCDLSQNMARGAATTLGASSRAGVVCADLSALPFDQRFDAVFSTATFHWIHDHDRLFSELRGVLREGGRLEAQCGGGPNLAIIHARADRLIAAEPYRSAFTGWRDPWRFATPEETENRLRRAGFGTARCWLEPAPTTFRDRDAFRVFLETVVMRPYLARIQAPAHREHFLEPLLAQAAADDPPFTLDYWRLNITATTR